MSTKTEEKAVRSEGVKATVTLIGDRELHIERVFNASRERVWKAHTEPRLIAQWWGRGNKLVVERFEPRAGGRWRFVEHFDGKEQGFEGRYLKVREPELIEMSFGWDGMPGKESLDHMEFMDLDDERTRLLCRTTFVTAADRDGMIGYGMEDGMNQSYQALDRVLAAM